MENICEWEKCNETGEFKAPTEKDNSRKFKWLCKEHIKLFNKNWNYFEGMSQIQIENFLNHFGILKMFPFRTRVRKI